MTRCLVSVVCALALAVVGCSSTEGAGGSGGAAGVGGGAGQGGEGGEGGEGGAAGGSGGSGGEGGAAGIRADFETSLHNTREGMVFWYARVNGGMEELTDVDPGRYFCRQCHNTNDDASSGSASCADCHEAGSDPPKHLQSETCLGCHGRGSESGLALQAMDVHADAYSCAGCHGSTDVHGNGTEYDSALRPGAVEARCADCHGKDVDGAQNPPDDAYHASMHAAVDCALCHAENAVSCVNCHLDDYLDNQEECLSGEVLDWKFVMKWDKNGDGNEVYHPASITTVKYNCDRDKNPAPCVDQVFDPKKTFAVFAPYYGHTVTQQAIDDILNTPGVPGAASPGDLDGCAYCHGAANCDTIVDAGDPKQKLIEFDGTKLVNPIRGLIPLPSDYRDRFAIDFVEWAEGPGTGCQSPPQNLVLFETGPDLWQTGEDTAAPNTAELGRPLTPAEFERFCPPPP